MNNYLFIDLGSTFTKLTLINFKKLEVIKTCSSPTTVNSDVTEGFKKALKLLEKKLGKKVTYEKAYSCSSAKGGLKMAAIGLVSELTTEASKRVCLGSGAKVDLVFSGILTKSEVKQIKEKEIDIILLAGGIDSGDYLTVIKNSLILAKENLNIPIVYAGNKDATDEVAEILNKFAVEFYLTENVMPKLNKLNIEPAKKIIEKIFIEKIINSKGIGNLNKYINHPIIPTPSAILNALKLLNDKKPTIIVDIGGATTDIYSVGYGYPKKINTHLTGLEEPFLKRTVEGDIGMRYSLLGLIANLSNFKKKELNEKFDLNNEINKRIKDVFYLPETEFDYLVEQELAYLCADIAFSRHVGKLKEIYTYNGKVNYQTGKDLTDALYVIGTGGVIINNPKGKEILKSVLINDSKLDELRPINPKILIDKAYLLSSIGLLSLIDKDKAYKLLEKEILNKGR